MKKNLLTTAIVFFSVIAKAQITGSDTVCAGYIYTYTANIPGAVSYNWTLPGGWYFITGEGTDSVVVNCNDSIGQVCVVGYDSGNNAVDTICKSFVWGPGGIEWFVSGI